MLKTIVFSVTATCLACSVFAEEARNGKCTSVNPTKQNVAAGSDESTPWTATKDQPYENSLGMRFVPVPGTKVLFCIWETRVQDYAAYAAANSGVDDKWKGVEWDGTKQGPDHPVVSVSWEDAKKFCSWLGKKEGVTYRLPTDHEWSLAVGIGDREKESDSPADKNSALTAVYPWGSAWPPPKGSGNFDSDSIDGYQDPVEFTTPVGTFSGSPLGLFDLEGNVWEFCEDRYDGKRASRVSRGGAWDDSMPGQLLSSFRGKLKPNGRYLDGGFRVVLELGLIPNQD